MGRILATLLILSIVVASLLFFPAQAGRIAAVVLTLGLAFSTVSIIRRQAADHREGRINRAGFVRNCIVEILGMLITLGLSMLLARWTITLVITRMPGLTGLLLGLLAALLIGATMSVLVQSTWGRLARRPASG